MFCPPELATRIDRAEGRLCAAIAGQRPEGRVIELSGGVAVFAAPDSPTNKMIGVGFSGILDEAALVEVETLFATHNTQLQAEISTLADPGVHAQLAARGYAPGGFEYVLGHPLATGIATPPSGIVVEAVAHDELPALADVMAEGFANPENTGGLTADALPAKDVIRRWFVVTMRSPGFRGYIARVDGEIAGGAALRVDGGIAQFSGAATLPRFRRRGVQTALLRSRLADSAREGCDIGVVVTQPASKSQMNVQREGFALLYARQLLVRSGGAR